MRISKFNFWKLISFVLIFLIIFIGSVFLKEYKKNIPYKKELEYLKSSLIKTKQENEIFQKQIFSQKDPLNFEKERKDKFGEALEGETLIIISEDLLKSITFPFLLK